uniref:Glucuronosyltransferase n=1 Tax=Plectus sambesii TaxID=2011161 RepID=A0A914XK82_9BILA
MLLSVRLCRCFGAPLASRSHSTSSANLVSHLPITEDGAFANKAALVFADGSAMTYSQLGRLTGRYAAYLNRLGLGKSDRLLAKVSKRPENVALYLATLRIGAVYVPINPTYTAAEIDHFIADAQPKMFVSDDMSKDRSLKDKVATVICENELAEKAAETQPIFDVEAVTSADIACLCYTSGTTGKPKGAMLTHGNLTSNAETLVDLWRFTDKDTMLHMLPVYHIHGLFVALHTCLLSGASIFFHPRFTIDAALKWLPKTSVLMAVPTYYSRLLAAKEFTSEVCKNVRLFVSGSAPLSPAIWDEFHKRTGHKILERYGMTEGLMVCSNPYEEELRTPGTIGKALPGIEVRVKDYVLQYRGPNVFKGYWRQPEKTKQEFTSDGFFISGDLASIDDNGVVRILGRGKDLIITGGLNVYPKEVEDALDLLPEVHESAVIATPHRDFGEAVLAVCVPSVQSDPKSLEATVISALKQKLAGYKVPKKIIFVQNLPRNSMGKVPKNVLRQTEEKAKGHQSKERTGTTLTLTLSGGRSWTEVEPHKTNVFNSGRSVETNAELIALIEMPSPRLFHLLFLTSLLFIYSDAVNILIFSPGFSNSHTIFSQHLAKSLLSEHHNVTVWTSVDNGVKIKDPPKAAQQIIIHYDLGEAVRNHFQDIAFRQNITFVEKTKGWNKFFNALSASCSEQLEDAEGNLARLKKQHFDIAIIPVFEYCALLLGSELRIKKYVFVNAGTYIFDHIAIQNGIPLHPSFVPLADSYYSDRMSFSQRFLNALQSTLAGMVNLRMSGSLLLEQYHLFAESIHRPPHVTTDFYGYIRDSSVGIMINGDPILNFPRPLPFDAFYLNQLGDVQDSNVVKPLEPKFDASMIQGTAERITVDGAGLNLFVNQSNTTAEMVYTVRRCLAIGAVPRDERPSVNPTGPY